jgi:hypothetical protein
MKLKKFDEFNLIKENILDDDDDENHWQVKVDGRTDSFWTYKSDAIDRIVELLNEEGNGLDGYKDEEEYEMSDSDITYMLDDLDEAGFYNKLEELKNFVGVDIDFKLINIDDEDELEFLEEE